MRQLRWVPWCLFFCCATLFGQQPGEFKNVSTRMQEFVERQQTAGVVTLCWHEGKPVHLSAVGMADVEGKRAMTTDTMFAIASMTKPISATALMILADEGKLSVDDPVSKYIPEFRDAALADGKPKREITLRDLLTHTSGLGGSQANEGTLAETAKALAARKLDFEPGSKWQYSPAISVCGRVVEVVSGQPFEDFLATRIFKPLKMVDTTFNPTPAQQKRLAKLYQPGPDKKSLATAQHWLNDLSAPRSPNPSGGLFSTAADLARFYQAILQGGELDGVRILSEKGVKTMTSVQTGELTTGFTPGNGWGFGWCVVREPQTVTESLSPGSFGHGGAFGTQGWVDPVQKNVFVLLVQRTNFGNSDGSDMRRVFQAEALKALKTE